MAINIVKSLALFDLWRISIMEVVFADDVLDKTGKFYFLHVIRRNSIVFETSVAVTSSPRLGYWANESRLGRKRSVTFSD